MRLLSIPAISALVLGVGGILGAGEFVRDWRAPVSHQSVDSVLSVTWGVMTDDLRKFEDASKRKYGEGSNLSLQINDGIVNLMRDGKILETHEQIARFEGVFGMFVAGRDNKVTARFPFSISLQQETSSLNRMLSDRFKNRYKTVPRQWLDFDDSQWTIDRCERLPAGLGLGWLGKALLLREGSACVVTWKGSQPSSMLISVSRAYGDPWMRPFARRICRSITESALQRFAPEDPASPKYAACILADRPAHLSAPKSLVTDTYAVGSGNELARVR
ncbi:hypothetical protein CQ12_35270 [Bradyrhizobium jicamae]|uniref:Uncharacterized protein n=1 Tax=Bradyrhizobium jicamae TaxID=280332 RepID=A0A0R3KV78_9BRAD|nr:hypothetical protein [Bradyrhizobium jicamae]KRQ99560.1 hypothetical protein CQ12_35270 [Bradyrhizobium jicamae]